MWQGAGRGDVGTRAGSGGPEPASCPVRGQENVPGRAAVSRGPAPPEAVRRGSSLVECPGQLPPRVSGCQLCTMGGLGRASLATEQRTGGRSLRSPAPPGGPAAEPLQPDSSPEPSPPATAAPPPVVPEWSRPRGRQKSSAPRVPTTPVQPLMPGSATVRGPGLSIQAAPPPSPSEPR